jgi:hypothetical protein
MRGLLAEQHRQFADRRSLGCGLVGPEQPGDHVPEVRGHHRDPLDPRELRVIAEDGLDCLNETGQGPRQDWAERPSANQPVMRAALRREWRLPGRAERRFSLDRGGYG